MHDVGVIGCGLMGSGIAEVAARKGCRVTVVELDADALERGRLRIDSSLARAARTAKVSSDEVHTACERISFSTDLAALGDATFVIEAVSEDESAKCALFARLDGVVRPDAVVASNTSSIPIITLARATSRPERVVGVHFFNPVPVMQLVEIIASLVTSPDTVARAHEFATSLGKQPITAPDQAGFIVNALLIPYLLSAVRMLESGAASAEDIDRGMTLGCAHPMGPLALADLIGLDTTLAVADTMYDEFRQPHLAAPALLKRMVQAGFVGRKSGRGFYQYH